MREDTFSPRLVPGQKFPRTPKDFWDSNIDPQCRAQCRPLEWSKAPPLDKLLPSARWGSERTARPIPSKQEEEEKSTRLAKGTVLLPAASELCSTKARSGCGKKSGWHATRKIPVPLEIAAGAEFSLRSADKFLRLQSMDDIHAPQPLPR